VNDLTKPLSITKVAYDRLKQFRDIQGLTSFSDAIQTLLNFHEGKIEEADAYFKTHFAAQIEAAAAEIYDKEYAKFKSRVDPLMKLLEEYLEKVLQK